MFENWDYPLAWLVYIAAGGGLCWLCWNFTRPMKSRALRDLIRWSLVVVIFAPWSAVPGESYLAPAATVVFFDLFTGGSEDISGSAMLLLFLLGGVLVILTSRILLERRSKGKKEALVT